MIPNFQFNGILPSGIHWSTMEEVKEKLCFSDKRVWLIVGLEKAIISLKIAGCETIYLDGSFATSKQNPEDIDVCWELLNVDIDLLFLIEPVFFDFNFKREAQKDKFGCEFFQAHFVTEPPDILFIDFFQHDRDGNPKGIIGLKI